MDTYLVYVKTPIGDEAVRQSTRVVKRNLRMVLVQVDGKLSVAELSAKIGNPQLVEAALRELEAEGYIAPTLEAISVWEEGVRKAQEKAAAPLSEFSTFGPVSARPVDSGYSRAMASSFSTFGKSTKTQRPAEPAASIPPPPMVAEKREFAKDRKPIPWGRVIYVLIFGLLLSGAGTLFLYPYDNLRPRIEAIASQYLQMPVHIGSVSVRYLPKPALLLSEIRLGEQGDSIIETIALPPLSLLGSGKHQLERVEISGVSFSVDRLLALPLFGSPRPDAQSALSIKRLVIERMLVKANDLVLQDLLGDVALRADGLVEKAEFQSADRSIRLSALPAPSGILLNIEGYAWKPFANTALAFDSLQAKGLLQRGKLVIQNFDSTLLGGVIKGSWIVDWSAGLAMAGDATLARLDARKVTAAFTPKFLLEGEIAGNLRLRGSGQDSSTMWRNAEASLDLAMINGVLHGVDLGEAVRRGAGSIVRGGSTKFDRLSGMLTVNARQLVGRAMQLDAGMVVAGGQFSVTPDQRVDANLVVTMQTSVATQRLPVKVGGTLPDLSTVASR